MIAGTLKGVISQRLVRTADGGRVATCEILRMTGRVRDMIMNPEETGRAHEVIAEGAFYGMQTFDQALIDHVQAGRVTMEEAVKAATHPARLQAARRLRRQPARPRSSRSRPPAAANGRDGSFALPPIRASSCRVDRPAAPGLVPPTRRASR